MQRWLAILVASASATACMAGASETYDLIFRGGTLDALPEAAVIDYAETGGETDQIVRLTIRPEEKTALERIQGDRHGTIGEFATPVGNPLIMYFMENAVREVAELSGGSPFYIRNRFKESLLEAAPVEEVTVTFDGAEIAAERITLHPLAGDAHAAKVGYDNVALAITVSEEVPGWYHTLSATGGPEDAAFETGIAILAPEEGSR